MTKQEISFVVGAAALLIATGVFFVVRGLSHNFDLSIGVGILSFCAAFYFIAESKDVKKAYDS
jgi:hypothetical protein